MSIGEVVRLLDQVSRRLDELTRTLEVTYLRRDVYEIGHAALEREVRELRRDADAIVNQQAANRRLAVSGLVLPIVSGLVLALLIAALLPGSPS